MEDFKYGGTNITSLRIVDSESTQVKKVVEEWIYGELRYGRSIDPSQKITVSRFLTEVSSLHNIFLVFYFYLNFFLDIFTLFVYLSNQFLCKKI